MSINNVTLGPIASGTVHENSLKDLGLALLTQTVTLTSPTAAGTYDNVIYLPAGAQITNILIDRLVASDAFTSAALTVGTASTGTQYVSSIDMKAAAGRTIPTFTAAQLLAMSNIGTNTAVYFTQVTVGAVTVGSAIATVHYILK